MKKYCSLSELLIDYRKISNLSQPDLPFEDDRIRSIHEDSDAVFVNEIQQMDHNLKPVNVELIKEAARIFPELNMVLLDQSDLYAGHIVILPLKLDSYQKIRDREMEEGSLSMADLSFSLSEMAMVFFLYSIYADSLPNSYYLVNLMLAYFKKKKFRHYIFAGTTYRKYQVNYLKEMGLQIIWENVIGLIWKNDVNKNYGRK